ncbi:MAG: hybrid sensor histidine kinase/response regulator [Chloroflexi bacterium]|nr:hybrid sensor histidine kinase/response regulator [Chloroflexota bacterium]
MSKHRILVVDDHDPLLKAIQGILEEEDYAIFTASDGTKALEMMREVYPHLIIADIMMPRMDGYALYEAIRSDPEWVSIPFIFLTAKAEREDRLKGKSMGAEDYLTKPFDPQELVVAVSSRLTRAKAIQQAADAQFDQLKQQIANVLGHELRTPLTYVRGYTELALEEVPSNEALQDFLMGIKRGADRLNQLVEDLMLMIQIDTGRTADEFQMMAQVHAEIESLLKISIQQHKQYAADQGVTLELAVEPNMATVRICDPIFMNALNRLIDNGIKFSHGEVKHIMVSARVTDGWVEIAVSDKGIGIAAKDMPHLFERFRQFNRDKMEQQGAGLGLALAQELIWLHNGEIAAESTVGEGSTFTIRLPIAPEPEFEE